MAELLLFDSFIKAFLLLFAIMDPFATVPVFLTLTAKFSHELKIKAANEALLVASIVVLIFLFFGTSILGFFAITLNDFRIAGGAVLLVLGAQLVFGYEKRETAVKNYKVAASIIGVPLITGPGVITTTIVLVASEGLLITLIAALLALFANWLILRHSELLLKLLGGNTIEILSKIMGLLLIAVAVGYIRSGLGG